MELFLVLFFRFSSLFIGPARFLDAPTPWPLIVASPCTPEFDSSEAKTGFFERQLGISKRGDAYVRTMLMHGARAIIARSKNSLWIQALLKRRPYSVVVAALANKLARTAWAVITKSQGFDARKWTNAQETAVAV